MSNWDRWIDEARKAREIHGEKKYGPIDPLKDPRCFISEAREELLDGLNYLQWAMEKGEMTFCEWAEISELLRMALGGLREAGFMGLPAKGLMPFQGERKIVELWIAESGITRLGATSQSF